MTQVFLFNFLDGRQLTIDRDNVDYVVDIKDNTMDLYTKSGHKHRVNGSAKEVYDLLIDSERCVNHERS